ncbi:unnamed protein product [Gulo gulo]|uniref:Pyrroline-5-carboxylate reductase catalytic N-terminal domain-containing protein n=1 Tax=Gulo gulo TaxID=48420 RepID=A0A9X9LSP7_GULGU|nr:unnamed protein product [Gulo gulo]
MAAAVAEPGADPLRVGFVGAGRMAEAIAQGFIRAGKVEAQHILASAPTDRNLCHFQALGCRTTHSNQEVLQSCLLVFFATKPHVLPTVLAEVAPLVTAEHILVSVAAGVSLSTLEELLPPMARVLRVSPNLPCMVQEGAMVMARGRHAGSSEAKLLQGLLEACGQCEEVPEAHVDVHTGLSGSGVAYVSVALSLQRLQPLGFDDMVLGLPGPPHRRSDPAGDSQDVAAEQAAPSSAANRRVHARRHHHLRAPRPGAGWAAGRRHERRGGRHLSGQGAQREVGNRLICHAWGGGRSAAGSWALTLPAPEKTLGLRRSRTGSFPWGTPQTALGGSAAVPVPSRPGEVPGDVPSLLQSKYLASAACGRPPPAKLLAGGRQS